MSRFPLIRKSDLESKGVSVEALYGELPAAFTKFINTRADASGVPVDGD